MSYRRLVSYLHCSLSHVVFSISRRSCTTFETLDFTREDFMGFFNKNLRKCGLRLYREHHYKRIKARISLLTQIGLTMEEIEQSIGRYHPFLAQETNDLHQLLGLMKNAFAFSDEELKSMLIDHPSIIASKEPNIKEVVRILEQSLRFKEGEYVALVKKEPSILKVNIQFGLSKLLNNLLWDMFMEAEHVKEMIIKYPKLMHWNNRDDMWPRVHCLRQYLKPNDELIRRLLIYCPQILSAYPGQMKETLLLLQTFFNRTKVALCRMVLECPELILTPSTQLAETLTFSIFLDF